MLEKIVRDGGLHPNRISALGLLASVASVGLASIEETKFLAPVVYALGAGCDYADGKVSRMYKLGTKEGAVLDPLCDKLKNLAVGGLMIYNEGVRNPMLAVANGVNFVVDYVSQRKRGEIFKQIEEGVTCVWEPNVCTIDNEVNSKLRANIFGKTKTAIQNISHLAYLSFICYNDHVHELLGENSDQKYLLAISGALMLGAVSGAVGILKRQRLKEK